jgi:plasmid stabilization system protein ParE
MANRPLKSPQTEIDLTAIWDYIAKDNPRAADTLLVRIEATFDMLADTRLPVANEANCAQVCAAFRSAIT